MDVLTTRRNTAVLWKRPRVLASHRDAFVLFRVIRFEYLFFVFVTFALGRLTPSRLQLINNTVTYFVSLMRE